MHARRAPHTGNVLCKKYRARAGPRCPRKKLPWPELAMTVARSHQTSQACKPVRLAARSWSGPFAASPTWAYCDGQLWENRHCSPAEESNQMPCKSQGHFGSFAQAQHNFPEVAGEGPVEIGVKIFRACECSLNGIGICNWSFLLESNWMETAAKSFLLEKSKENCRKEFSTGKTQGKLQERVFYWKSSRKTAAGKSFLLFSTTQGKLQEIVSTEKNSRKTAGNFFEQKSQGKNFESLVPHEKFISHNSQKICYIGKQHHREKGQACKC